MASALSRGNKVVVMTLQEWQAHPDRATVVSADGKRRIPILTDGISSKNTRFVIIQE